MTTQHHRVMRYCKLIPAFMMASLSPPVTASRKTVWNYSENFESGSDDWSMFEEIVSECYGLGIGSINATAEAAYEGSLGLTVSSNAANSLKSNHVIAYRNVEYGVYGRWIYELYALLPAAYEETSQIGPEFSVQNTRSVATGGTTTCIAGIQHIASKYLSAKWNIWEETATNVATWEVLPDSRWRGGVPPVIEAGEWYRCLMDIDYDADEYISLTIQKVGSGSAATADLRGIKIAPELRSFEAATVITLEAENLYNNCGSAGAFESKMYYDKVTLSKTELESNKGPEPLTVAQKHQIQSVKNEVRNKVIARALKVSGHLRATQAPAGTVDNSPRARSGRARIEKKKRAI